MYSLYDEMITIDEIDEEVDTISKIFDEFSLTLRQNFKKFKIEETLVDDKPIVKLLIKKEIILTIYNYEPKKIVFNNNEFIFKHIKMFYVLDFENKINFLFVDEINRYHRLIYNFYEVA